jgi:hypothetical protein
MLRTRRYDRTRRVDIRKVVFRPSWVIYLASAEYPPGRGQGKPPGVPLDFGVVVNTEIHAAAIDAAARRQDASPRPLRPIGDGRVGVTSPGWHIENRHTWHIGPRSNSEIRRL